MKCDRGLALMGYYYFDFKDISKQGIHGLLTSLLSQLSAKSDPCYQILSNLYSENNAGSQQPDNHALNDCLKEMLRFPITHLWPPDRGLFCGMQALPRR